MSYAFDWIVNHRWAILPEVLKTIARISFGEISAEEGKKAIAARDGEYLDNTYTAEKRGSVAVIPVIGPIYSKGNYVWRGSSVNVIAKDFTSALDDTSVTAIVLNIHSPGGEITGVHELSKMIFDARGKKPIIAYVYGLGASAAYWIGSGASKIVIAETAEVGSIGVVSVYVDFSKFDEKMGIKEYEIVSSQSPKKRLTPATEEGKAETQRIVDELADVFVSSVAKNRGVTTDVVLEKFGQGSVLIGQSAVDAGLADEIGSLESVLASLNSNTKTTLSTGGFPMNPEELQAKHPDTYNAVFLLGKKAGQEEEKKASVTAIDNARKEGAEKERSRMQGIYGIKIPGSEKIVSENIFKPEATKESVSVLILEAQQEGKLKIQTAMNKDSQNLANQLGEVENNAPETNKSAKEEECGKSIAKFADGIDV